MSHEVRDDLQYTKDHEWVGGSATERTIGITSFAVDQLGDITLVNLEVKVGDSIVAGKSFGTVESVKTLSDLFAPVSGKVVKVNGDLESKPELVNEDCYGRAWMIAIAPEGAAHELMDAAAYRKFLETAAHLVVERAKRSGPPRPQAARRSTRIRCAISEGTYPLAR